MRKITISGRDFTLCNADEVPTSAVRELKTLEYSASLNMMSREDVLELLDSEEKEEANDTAEGRTLGKTSQREDENQERGESRVKILSRLRDMDEARLKRMVANLEHANLSNDDRAIILSARLGRAEIDELPYLVMRELAVEADKELGGVRDFFKRSVSNTSKET